jgi:hypothetical protein
MKILFLLAMFFFSLSASASESPFKMSVEALVTKSNKTGDISYLGMAAIRCAALYNTYLTLVELNMDIKNDGAVSHSLYMLGVKIKAHKMQEHGAKESFIASMPDKAMEDIQKHSLVYWEWLKNNKESTGDYAASSPEFIKEQQQCQMIYSLVQADSEAND